MQKGNHANKKYDNELPFCTLAYAYMHAHVHMCVCL